MKRKVLVSFSGGETSAYMAKWLKDNRSDVFDLVFVMANTGRERPETIEFARRCDEEWGLNLVIVEAVVHHGVRKASTHRVVTWDNLSMNGEPFKEVIRKYGIPNVNYLHCTRELKNNPVRSYANTLWGKGGYWIAVGIRDDEVDRIAKDYKQRGFFYPLISIRPTKKPEINRFFRDNGWRLNLRSWEGNCRDCWKKSLRKLMQIAKERPQDLDWTEEMEREYGEYNPPNRSKEVVFPIRFFRGNRSVNDIRELAKEPFEPPKDDSIVYRSKPIQTSLFDRPLTEELDLGGGCGESCEVFTDEGI